jgi:hypothetical protein
MLRIFAFTLTLTMSATAAVRIEKTGYQGWANCYRITNGEIELIVTADVGPRIMRCAFVGGQNLFKEFPEQLGKSGERDFQLRGGHRLWVAPERLATTWAPDNAPVKIDTRGDVLEATAPVEPSTGLQKQIVVRMEASEARVEVLHRVTNTGPWTIELAPWALTMLAPGGTEVMGLPPRGKHPEVLLPTNPLVMWAYTDLSDKRWRFTKKYLILRQDPKVAAPQKLGLFNPRTWAAYLVGSDLFVKQLTADPARIYPDFGCSFETFTNAEFLEMETLGPIAKLEPGQAAVHLERWSLRKGVRVAAWSDAELDKVLLPALGK